MLTPRRKFTSAERAALEKAGFAFDDDGTVAPSRS